MEGLLGVQEVKFISRYFVKRGSFSQDPRDAPSINLAFSPLLNWPTRVSLI